MDKRPFIEAYMRLMDPSDEFFTLQVLKLPSPASPERTQRGFRISDEETTNWM